MTFSIIVPTKDRPADLQNCLKSIVRQTVLPLEVIVVDASSDNISIANRNNAEKIMADKKVKLIYIHSEPGVNKQRNLGADNASGDIIFFLDDDVVIKEDYCEKILEVYKLKGDQNLGGVQGCSLNYYHPSRINNVFRKLFFMTRISENERSRFLPSMGYVYIEQPKEIIEVESLPSLVCSYYRSVFNEFRFDESFDRCTDLELSYRVSRKYKLYQTPYASAYHHHSKSTHLSIRQLNKLYIIYTHRLVKKHLPRKMANWLAYYWSVVGEVILSTVKSFARLNPDPLIGTLEGLKHIISSDSNSREK